MARRTNEVQVGVGLMSGTSADGIDAAVVRIRRSRQTRGRLAVRTLAAVTVPYPAALRARLLSLPDVHAAEIAHLDALLGERLADAAHASGGRLTYDPAGRLAAQGAVDRPLLSDLLAHPFLARRPPKSTGREEFGVTFLAPLLRRAKSPRAKRDLVATLTAFTAASILVAYDAFLPPVDEVVVSGGGARNLTLLAHLSRGMAERGRGVGVTSAARGVDPDCKEAIAFALLGWAHREGIANTVPQATGARHAVVSGATWPGRRPSPAGAAAKNIR